MADGWLRACGRSAAGGRGATEGVAHDGVHAVVRLHDGSISHRFAHRALASSRMESFERLEVWRRAFALIRPVYRLTARYPKDERFGLISQTRNAVTAVPTNIAEGSRRRTAGEFRNSLSVAAGENAEHECLLMVGVELGFAAIDDVRPILTEIRTVDRMLRSFDQTLARRYAKPHKNTRPPHSQPATPKTPARLPPT